jgi:hypothetical protein
MADDDLTTQLVDLQRAYRSGALKVVHKDSEITYRSMEDLRAAIAALEAEIGIQKVRTVRVRAEKGW